MLLPTPDASSHRRVSCLTASPLSISSICRSASYLHERSTARNEFRFLVSVRVPNGSPFFATDRLTSQRRLPSCIFTSLTPVYLIMLFSAVRNATASSGE